MVGYLCFSCCFLLFSTASICMMSSMVSSCDIIGTLGVITLSGGTVIGILGGGIVGTSLGNTLVWVFSGCMVLNLFSNILMACNFLSPIVKGVCGTVFLSTCISSLADLLACSVVDNPGMTRCCGTNSTTYGCL